MLEVVSLQKRAAVCTRTEGALVFSESLADSMLRTSNVGFACRSIDYGVDAAHVRTFGLRRLTASR